MTVSYVGAQGAATTTVTIPAHQVGDLILIFAYRDGSNTSPTVPTAGGTVPTWTTIGSTGGNTNSSVFAYATATATTTTSGTWTNATELICLVYRGATIGASAGGSGNATTSIAYPALTLQRTNNSSWVVGVAGHRTATNVEVAPTGMTNRASSGTEAAGHDTNSTVTSWSQQTVTVNASSAYRSWTVELRDKTIVLVAERGLFNNTFIDANLVKSRTLVADKGTFTVTGNGAGVNHNAKLIADVRVFTVASVGAGVLHNARVTSVKGTYTLTGRDAGINKGFRLVASTGSFNDDGKPANILHTAVLVAGTGARTLSGIPASINKGRSLVAAAGSFSVAGSPAGLIRSGSKLLAADTGTFARSSVGATIAKGSRLVAAASSYSVVGKDAGLRRNAKILGDTVSYLVTRNPAGLARGRYLYGAPRPFAVTGQAAVLAKAYRLVADGSSPLSISTQSFASILAGRKLSSAPGSLSISASSATLNRGRTLIASAATISLTLRPATLLRTAILRAAGEEFQYAVNDTKAVVGYPAKEIKTYAGGLLNIDQFYKARQIKQRFNLSGRR